MVECSWNNPYKTFWVCWLVDIDIAHFMMPFVSTGHLAITIDHSQFSLIASFCDCDVDIVYRITIHREGSIEFYASFCGSWQYTGSQGGPKTKWSEALHSDKSMKTVRECEEDVEAVKMKRLIQMSWLAFGQSAMSHLYMSKNIFNHRSTFSQRFAQHPGAFDSVPPSASGIHLTRSLLCSGNHCTIRWVFVKMDLAACNVIFVELKIRILTFRPTGNSPSHGQSWR